MKKKVKMVTKIDKIIYTIKKDCKRDKKYPNSQKNVEITFKSIEKAQHLPKL